jgi:hypothetical protein
MKTASAAKKTQIKSTLSTQMSTVRVASCTPHTRRMFEGRGRIAEFGND